MTSQSNAPVNVAGDGIPDEFAAAPVAMVGCPKCGRKFNENAAAKHIPNCKGNEKRKVFNSAMARITGNEHINKDEMKMAIQARKEIVKEKRLADKGVKVNKKKDNTKWKEESKQFREAMKANRLMAKAEKEGKSATFYLDQEAAKGGGGMGGGGAPSVPSNYVNCPHCGRNFNEKAGARHIPKCKDMQHNKPNRKLGGGGMGGRRR